MEYEVAWVGYEMTWVEYEVAWVEYEVAWGEYEVQHQRPHRGDRRHLSVLSCVTWSTGKDIRSGRSHARCESNSAVL